MIWKLNNSDTIQITLSNDGESVLLNASDGDGNTKVLIPASTARSVAFNMKTMADLLIMKNRERRDK